jgi:hypothetical protein
VLLNEFRDFYSSPSRIRMMKSRMKWAGHVTRMRNMRNTCRILVRQPEGKRTRTRWRRMRKYNITVGRSIE